MISIDSSSGGSPVEQIRSQLAARIRAGQLAADVRLPSVRQLAADLAHQATHEGLSLRDTQDLLARAWTQLHPEPGSHPNPEDPPAVLRQ